MLEQSILNEEAMKRELAGIRNQNKTLEVLLIQVKTIVEVQQEMPPQVLLGRPVILVDAFEENRLPFHLEFINSFEALFAVFVMRFRHRGDGAVMRIRRQMFDMYESSKQQRVDLNGPWVKAFLVRIFLVDQEHVAENLIARTTRRDEYAHSRTT
jgi:hypothetical protein